MIKYIKEIIIVILLIWVSITFIFDDPEVITETETVTVTDTLTVTVESPPEIKWYPKTVKDTNEVKALNNLIDSLQQAMNDLIDSTDQIGDYVAKQDTVIKDSTGQTVATIKTEVLSRIPLDPMLRVRSDVKIFNKTTTNTITIKPTPTFWQRFGISAQVGVGMGLTTKQIDAYVGIGIHFQLN